MKHAVCTALLFISTGFSVSAQCNSSFKIVLKNINGGFYKGQKVTATEVGTGNKHEVMSNEKGEAVFTMACNTTCQVSVSNYSRVREASTPGGNGLEAMMAFSYESTDLKTAADFAMSDAEKAQVNAAFTKLPDSTFVKNSVMAKPADADHYHAASIRINDLLNKPLVGETVYLTGKKRGKTIIGTTDVQGKLEVYLPKCDQYQVHFKFHRNYYDFESECTSGTGQLNVSLSYLGTAEIARRKKAEEERIKAEEKRLEEERKRFEEERKREKLSAEEAYKRRLEEYADEVAAYKGELKSERSNDEVVSKVLQRNKWVKKLIVCDITGSMMPYVGDLLAWYKLRFATEKDMQFVFFNDGDAKQDSEKIIGKTGGIYYSGGMDYEGLKAFMAMVAAKGSGGDCPENNLEALIKAKEQAKTYQDLIMVADNNAPVKDIKLLRNFKSPVHVIVCGSRTEIHPDYLLIAWKTGGSVHTIEEDIVKIAKMAEGQEITIGGILYRIMGGEFVRVTKT